jgi:AraC-like DNA-binding protein
LPAKDLRQLGTVRIRGTEGVGASSSQFLLQLAQHMDELSPSDTARLSTLTVDVLTTALATALEVDSVVPPHTRRRALLAQIHAFANEHLGDAHLTPNAIATANHISLRYLHKLFQEEGRTVAGWVRERRLEQCRGDLADPRLAGRGRRDRGPVGVQQCGAFQPGVPRRLRPFAAPVPPAVRDSARGLKSCALTGNDRSGHCLHSSTGKRGNFRPEEGDHARIENTAEAVDGIADLRCGRGSARHGGARDSHCRDDRGQRVRRLCPAGEPRSGRSDDGAPLQVRQRLARPDHRGDPG